MPPTLNINANMAPLSAPGVNISINNRRSIKPTSAGKGGKPTKPTSLLSIHCLYNDRANANISPVHCCFHSFRQHPMPSCSRQPQILLPTRKFYINCIDQSSRKLDDIAEPQEAKINSFVGVRDFLSLKDGNLDVDATIKNESKRFDNRFLNFAKLGSIINNAVEGFFKSEIRRRLFVTAVLILVSRVGYFIPLPGFDRRLVPDNYLNFAAGSIDELGDFTSELKLSLFQLGISPQIAASILMQAILVFLCVKLIVF